MIDAVIDAVIDVKLIPKTLTFLLLALPQVTAAFTPEDVWNAWPEERFIKTAAPCLRPAELNEALVELADKHDAIELREIGRSYEDRPIHMFSLGRGDKKILLWSQMHGDEPSATPALFDIADFLLLREEDPDVRAILDNFTLLMIPMLNPDGSERYERRNAQGIDINRDALHLATPEGRLLKKIRGEHAPFLGFNLHDQNRRTRAGDSDQLATMAVLAVAGDPEGTVTPGRLRAKRACTAIVEAVAPFNPGGMARYDEDWNPRAFGDNMTAWGTPTVLIESGGLPPGMPFTDLTRLNAVAILTVLRDMARDDLAAYDPEVYDNLHRNRSRAWVDVIFRGGSIRPLNGGETYRADLAFNLYEDELALAGCRPAEATSSQVIDIGDLHHLRASREIDLQGKTLAALRTSPLLPGRPATFVIMDEEMRVEAIWVNGTPIKF